MVYYIVGPSILGPLLKEMTTEYSSPYKVGLIYVGTKFAQSRLLWSEVAYGKLNFRGTVANANLGPHQSVQAIIQGGTRYVDFFFGFLAD